MTNEWLEWHRGYEGDKPLARRLRVVQDRIREGLDRCPPGPIQVLSLCAGDGRDLLGVLANHPRTPDVGARLVELTPELVARGRQRAAADGRRNVNFVQGDASTTSACTGAVPADLVLVCGIFGNISDADVRRTIALLPELCRQGATVVWTRGRFEPDLTPTIRTWFTEAGFTELKFVTIPGTTMSIGAHRLDGAGRRLRPGVRLFTFLPKEQRPSTPAEAQHAGPMGA